MISPWRIMLHFMVTSHVLAVISLVFFPLPVQGIDYDDPLKVQLVPFETIYETFFISGGYYLSEVAHIFGNVLMFLPLGFYLPLISRRVTGLKQVFFFILVSSLLIEFMQLLLSFVVGPYRSVDIDDLILNTLGGVLGYFLLQPFKPTLQKLFSSKPVGEKPSVSEAGETVAQ